MDCNAADTAEVSSDNLAPRLPAGPSQIAQTMHTLQVAVLKASTVAEVSLPRLNFFFTTDSKYITSPVPEIRVE